MTPAQRVPATPRTPNRQKFLLLFSKRSFLGSFLKKRT
jgi:hypothetical protein